MNMEYASLSAEPAQDFSFLHSESNEQSSLGHECDPIRAADVPGPTRKVWLEFLALHDVTSAILSVSRTFSSDKRHAFLIGFESLRHNPHSTQRILAVAERLWLRMADQPSLQLQSNVIDAARSCLAEQGTDTPVEDTLTEFGNVVVVQKQHAGATVRAMFFRPKNIEKFSDKDVRSLQSILPILADSTARGAQLTQQSQRSAMLEAMFDRVSLSMMMLSADSLPIFMNSSASQLLDERNWLIRSADGSISGSNSKQAKQLRESIRLAATADMSSPVEAVYRLDGRDGDWRLVYVLSAMARSGESGTRCALLFILAPGRMTASAQMLEALGLLPSEQRFLGHFLKSNSLCDAAVDCGLSEESARTYLKRVRAKLGVHRQMELAGLISGLVLPVSGNCSTSFEG